jgi:Protein of unknown function (DUF2950)
MIVFRSIGRAALVGAAAVMTLALLSSESQAQQAYPSPEDAAAALVAAVKTGTKTAILKVLGSDAEDIVESGDDVADAEARQRFLTGYDARHSIKAEGKKATLILGSEDFPFPIPLIGNKRGWEFDTTAGRTEILYRRIGRNELDAIQTCLAYVDAQNEYADKDRGEGAGVYAQRIISSSGKKDGLYWPASDGDASPLGELVAQASAEGYKAGEGRTPYHGYYYRILTQQGPNAPGGALNYVVKGKMMGGFALVAYPAEYRNSGVMTFVVNHVGMIYQKDLGENTAAVAKQMMFFDPDKSWKKVDAANARGP